MGKRTRALGKNNALLWHISDDLKRFKALTTGHPIIMGRKTFESIGKALPNRTNIVITRNAGFAAAGTLVVHSLDEALEEAGALDPNVFVIGGGEIYREALPRADILHLTLVESDEKGDVFFPDWSEFKKVISEEPRVDEKTGLSYTWLDTEKYSPSEQAPQHLTI